MKSLRLGFRKDHEKGFHLLMKWHQAGAPVPCPALKGTAITTADSSRFRSDEIPSPGFPERPREGISSVDEVASGRRTGSLPGAERHGNHHRRLQPVQI